MQSVRRSSLQLFALIGAFCSGAATGAGIAAEKSILIGAAYVPPAYQAGVKFRTSETLDMELAQNVAKETRSSVKSVHADPAKAMQLLNAGKLDAWIGPLPSSALLNNTVLAIPTGYAARPMAIMRTDTTIKSDKHLRGRKVCVAKGSPYVGMLASTYGAVETVAPAPADSLLAVRTGACDAAVHDSALLEELIKLPEWKKFSASLYLGPMAERPIIIRRDDVKLANAVKKTLNEWQRSDFIHQEIKRKVRHIAFEVYLDQDVPDCH